MNKEQGAIIIHKIWKHVNKFLESLRTHPEKFRNRLLKTNIILYYSYK